MKEYSSGAPFFEASIYAMLTRILVLIGRAHAEMANRLVYDDTRQRQYVEKFMAVCRFIDERCTEDLTLDEAAAYAGFSRYHFTRLFRQFAGTTFSHYMNQKRIAKAEKYLADPAQSVATVLFEHILFHPDVQNSERMHTFRVSENVPPDQPESGTMVS